MSWQFDSEVDWMRRAACVGTDGDRFFSSELGGRPSLRDLPCSSCTVRQTCGEYAEHEGLVGIWGGGHIQGSGC